ncbi:hypothetical protein EJ02DRAFT_468616 [Clathrospora elynae]|uniref:Uncharacterized protein n=1 Tax=Clathrospora elynae TaxID=706981 RepID=A0A6A5SDR3_9PLEO|nr:hypothetical protein EJ02DRAFT_468616 [Clathrospora elynae]
MQWELKWPGDDDTFEAILAKRNNASVSFTALISNKPSIITDRYNDSDNGNCTTMLSEQCIDLIEPNSNDPNATTLHQNSSLLCHISETYTLENSTLFNQSRSAVQVFVMTFKYWNDPRGDSSGATVLCRIVNKGTKLAPVSAAVGWRQSIVAVWGIVALSTLAIMWQ